MKSHYFHNTGCLVLLLGFFICLPGCSKDECDDPVKYADLIVTPSVNTHENFIKIPDHGEIEIYFSTYPATRTKWAVNGVPEWLNIDPMEGEINKDMVPLNVKVVFTALESNDNFTEIIVNTSELGEFKVKFRHYMKNGFSVFRPSLDVLLFDFYDDKKEFFIKNIGVKTYDWNVGDTVPLFINISPESGFIPPGDSLLITVDLDRSDLLSGTFDSIVDFNVDNRIHFSIPIVVKNYYEEKWLLDNNIKRANMDPTSNKIVAICDDPNGIMVIDAEFSDYEFIPLDYTPMRFSINPLGGKAAVISAHEISHIDLSTGQVLLQAQLNFIPSDIVYGPEEIAYVLYEGDDYINIYNLDLNTGDNFVKNVPSLDGWIKSVKLHPSKKFLYGLISDDLVKFSIENDTIEYLYSNSIGYHDEFWFFPDGSNLVSCDGGLWRCSEDPELDMENIGYSLFGNDDPEWVYPEPYLNTIYTTFGNKIGKYNYDDFDKMDNIALPDFFVDLGTSGSTFKSRGKYVFINSDASKVICLLKAADNFPLINDWAIYVQEISKIKN